MWSPVRLKNGTTRPYGFGWGLDTYRGHRIVEHGGSWQGFGAHLVRYIDDGVSVAVLTNLTGIGNSASLIAHKIARYYVPALRSSEWPATAAIRIDPARLARHAGEYRLGEAHLRITNEGDHLILSAAGRGRARLIPISATGFRLEADSVRLRFVDSPAGAVLYVREGAERRATRIR
jgi:hypothetical protein